MDSVLELQKLLNRGEARYSYLAGLNQYYTEAWKEGLMTNAELSKKITGNSMSTSRLYQSVMEFFREYATNIPNNILIGLVFEDDKLFDEIMDINERYLEDGICPICGDRIVPRSNEYDQGYNQVWTECPRGCKY